MQQDSSLRKKLSDAAGWIMAGWGLAAVIIITALFTSIDAALAAGVLFLGLLAGGFLSIAAHELGHAAAARLVGWRVWIISVLGVVTRPGHGLRLSTRYSHDVGGYVLASPPNAAQDSRWRSIVVSAGGPLVSVLTGPIFIAWLIALPIEGWRQTPFGESLFASALAFGVASCAAALATLWPSRGRDGRSNDMRMILDAAFNRDPPTDVRGASWAWTLFEFGVEPDVWPHWIQESIGRSASNPWISPVAPLLAFFHALQSGDETAARRAAKRSAHEVDKLMRAYVCAYFDNDAAAAEAELRSVEIVFHEDSLRLLRDFVNARSQRLRATPRPRRVRLPPSPMTCAVVGQGRSGTSCTSARY